MRVVGEQDQCGETGRTDGVALGHCLGGVADGVERIGDRAHFRRQFGHFGNATGVVGDRTIGVERDDDTGHRQHRGGGNRQPVQATTRIRCPDRSTDGQHRQRRGLHRNPDAGNHVGRVTGLAGCGDMLDRRVFGTGVVLGDPHHRRGQHQADDGTDKHAASGDAGRRIAGTDQPGGHRVVEEQREHAGNDQALVQRAHDLAAVGSLDEVATDDRGDDRHRAQGQRIEDQRVAE